MRGNVPPLSFITGARAFSFNQKDGGGDGYRSNKSSAVGADIGYGSFMIRPASTVFIDSFPLTDWRDRTLFVAGKASESDLRPGFDETLANPTAFPGGPATLFWLNELFETGAGWDGTSALGGAQAMNRCLFRDAATGALFASLRLYADYTAGGALIMRSVHSANLYVTLLILGTPQLNKRITLP